MKKTLLLFTAALVLACAPQPRQNGVQNVVPYPNYVVTGEGQFNVAGASVDRKSVV